MRPSSWPPGILFQFLSHFQCTDHLYYCHKPSQVPQIHKYQLSEHIIYEHLVAWVMRWWLLSPGVLCRVNVFPNWICFKKANIYLNNYPVTGTVLICELCFLTSFCQNKIDSIWGDRGASVGFSGTQSPKRPGRGCRFGQEPLWQRGGRWSLSYVFLIPVTVLHNFHRGNYRTLGWIRKAPRSKYTSQTWCQFSTQETSQLPHLLPVGLWESCLISMNLFPSLWSGTIN